MRFALAMAGAAGFSAAVSAQNLTMAVGAPVTSLDPHFHQLSPNNAVAGMIFDRLVNTDAQSRMVPGLAESWSTVAPDVWEFRLRRGVKFHNGRDFTAEDVAFTLARVPNVPNSPSSFAAFVRPIRSVEVVDSHTIRFTTNGPYPLLPQDLTNVYILDRETHEGASTEDFNAGRAAVGTGPF
ncbi:MAG TPA: ABC transporter substrate-binding protein, partial [Roseococcus sp.]|nr:ABC transporter substrate-binding protein [Roseococcus sp.]